MNSFQIRNFGNMCSLLQYIFSRLFNFGTEIVQKSTAELNVY
jgi:hypothetical protein